VEQDIQYPTDSKLKKWFGRKIFDQ
jgi:hypothetical protein